MRKTKRINTDHRYRRTAKGAAALLLTFVLLFAGAAFFGTQSAYAMSCYIDAQPEQAQVGDSVTVTIVFSGDNVGRVRATLEYDTSVLSYQGEEGDSGEVSLYMASSGGDIVYTLPFKAVGAGSSDLVMTPLDAYDMDELPASLPEAQAMTVTVEGSETPETQPADDPDKEDPKEGDSTETDVTDDPQNTDPAEPDVTEPEKEPEKPQEPERSNAAVFVLAGLAVLIAAALIAVVILRGRREED